jgi:hypothetical protein
MAPPDSTIGEQAHDLFYHDAYSAGSSRSRSPRTSARVRLLGQQAITLAGFAGRIANPMHRTQLASDAYAGSAGWAVLIT